MKCLFQEYKVSSMSEIIEVHHTNSLNKITWLYIYVYVCLCVSMKKKACDKFNNHSWYKLSEKKEYRSTTSPWQKAPTKKTIPHGEKNECFSIRLGMRQDVLEVLASGMRQRKERHSDWKKNNCLYWQIPRSLQNNY